jgi:hypothetical protein
MARENNTFAKRQREVLKRQKAENKRLRRQKKRDIANVAGAANSEERTAVEP